MDSIVGKFGIDEANQTTHHFDHIDDIYLENAIDHAAITLERGLYPNDGRQTTGWKNEADEKNSLNENPTTLVGNSIIDFSDIPQSFG